jgi:hypothetical protein
MRPADWLLIGTVHNDENAIFGTSPASEAVSRSVPSLDPPQYCKK